MNAERPCSKCGIPKPPEAFYPAPGGSRLDRRRSECIECKAREYREQAQAKVDRVEALDWRTMVGATPLATGTNSGHGCAYWSPEERFWRLTEAGAEGCILWTGGRFPSQYRPGFFYGVFSAGGKSTAAHRYAYSIAYGKIPDRFEVHHTCLNTLCVNPEHLEALSKPAHSRVSGMALRTHCPKGHPYDEANTRWYQGRRYCRGCGADRILARSAARRARWEKSQDTPTVP